MINAGYTLEDFIKVAKRENNAKRSYLYVNPLQGKHVPVSPIESISVFTCLAKMLERKFPQERLLIIGFAETATAIGSTIAYEAENADYYMNTTREDVFGADYLFFTESHSHATEQRLVKKKLDVVLDKIDRIVFAEDEVTTGNTIEKLINAIKSEYRGVSCKFSIISILNSMSDERMDELQRRDISCEYLHRIPFEYRVEDVNKYEYERLRTVAPKVDKIKPIWIDIDNSWNCRVVQDTVTMREKINNFVEKTMEQLSVDSKTDSLLVMGTEEFMFPGMLLGKKLEQQLNIPVVRFHATTRSPIEISLDQDYPLHNRTPLESLYAQERKTFIYNLQTYDRVIIVTDSNQKNIGGIQSLLGALEEYGNKNVTVVNWGDANAEE